MLSRRPILAIALVFATILTVGVAANLMMPSPTAPVDGPGHQVRRLASVPDAGVGSVIRPAEPGATEAAQRTHTGAPGFDILRIDPSGQSVFAGRAEPDADIAILAGSLEIARTRSASDGTWSIVTGSIYKGGDVMFRVAATKDGRTVTSDAVVIAVPVTPEATSPATRATAAAKARPSDAGNLRPAPSAVGRADTRELERLVEGVRTNPTLANNPERSPEVIPLPITFETGRAVFTPEGRRAADLLVEYVQGAGLKSLTLSGHADERGPDRYNMRLSRKRLEAIAAYLRAQGYGGELTLIAKGESEPFKGVDRSTMAQAELWRIDRRVELRTR